MRVLAVLAASVALAAPAAAAPRFALFDLQLDVAHASRNAFGDVAAKPRGALAGRGTLVRCATWCRFGGGWLAFRGRPRLGAADVARASLAYSRTRGWTVTLDLAAPARRRWTAFARGLRAAERRRGVPDVLVVVAGGQVAAAPYASELSAAHGRLTLSGLGKPAAQALLQALS